MENERKMWFLKAITLLYLKRRLLFNRRLKIFAFVFNLLAGTVARRQNAIVLPLCEIKQERIWKIVSKRKLWGLKSV